MTALLTADRCPSCTGVHGQPTDWPVCPEHEHLLFLVYRDDAGYTYRCPARAPRCKHTHTQQERATMTTTSEGARAALAIRDGQGYWDERQLAALQQLGIKDVTKADLQVFMHYCQRTGLDPFSRQIYMISRRTKEGGEWVTKQTIQVGIDGYRVIAQRAARRDGVTLSYGNTTWYDSNGDPHEVWISSTPPAAASVTIYRDNKPFPGVARFAAFAAFDKDGNLLRQWATMGDHLIAKCAEAQALRKAFPHDLVGIQTDDEASHLGNRAPKMPLTVTAGPAPRQQAPPGQDPETLTAACRAQFDRLSLVDESERDWYAYRLAGAQDGEPLTAADLAKVLSALESCDDLEQLREITGDDAA